MKSLVIFLGVFAFANSTPFPFGPVRPGMAPYAVGPGMPAGPGLLPFPIGPSIPVGAGVIPYPGVTGLYAGPMIPGSPVMSYPVVRGLSAGTMVPGGSVMIGGPAPSVSPMVSSTSMPLTYVSSPSSPLMYGTAPDGIMSPLSSGDGAVTLGIGAGSSGIETVSPGTGEVSSAVVEVSPEISAVSPEISGLAPGISAMSPGIGAVAPGISTMSPEVMIRPDVSFDRYSGGIGSPSVVPYSGSMAMAGSSIATSPPLYSFPPASDYRYGSVIDTRRAFYPMPGSFYPTSSMYYPFSSAVYPTPGVFYPASTVPGSGFHIGGTGSAYVGAGDALTVESHGAVIDAGPDAVPGAAISSPALNSIDYQNAGSMSNNVDISSNQAGERINMV